MPVATERALLDGAAGRIEVASSIPDEPRSVAVIAHPHPLFGGTMDNKVVTTLVRAFVESGAATFRFNFRGVGASEGVHDEGRGETDDMLQVIAHAKGGMAALPLKLAGFSFGGAIAVRASASVEFAQLVLVAGQEAARDEAERRQHEVPKEFLKRAIVPRHTRLPARRLGESVRAARMT